MTALVLGAILAPGGAAALGALAGWRRGTAVFTTLSALAVLTCGTMLGTGLNGRSYVLVEADCCGWTRSR